MNQNENESSEPVGFSSSDSVIVVIDGPGDATIRPMDPQLKKIIEEGMKNLRRRQAERTNPHDDEMGK